MTFDLWNTLLYEQPGQLLSARVRVWSRVLREAGRPQPDAAIREALSAAWRAYDSAWRAGEQFHPQQAATHAVRCLGIPRAHGLRALLADAIVSAVSGGDVHLAPDVESTLVSLHGAGLRLGIVCDVGLTPGRKLRDMLADHGVLRLFSGWAFSDEIGVYKPSPLLFAAALRQLNGVSAARSVHVGDLRRTDVAGARAAGMVAVRYTGLTDDPEHGPEADHVIASHKALVGLLGIAGPAAGPPSGASSRERDRQRGRERELERGHTVRIGPRRLADLDAYVRLVRAGASPGREPAAEGPCREVNADPVRWRRLRAMHLHRRLSASSSRLAAWAGLQDTSPRSALLELHARMRRVGPSAWEHPDLVQVWFRWSDYVVPRADVALFTLATLPRDPDHAAALDKLAVALLQALAGRPRTYREIQAAGLEFADLPLRATASTGKVHIRWDASSIVVIPADPPAVDAESARIELARRFLHWHGPAGPAHFAKWAGVPKQDARDTWTALAPELVPVSLEGRARWLLAADEPALAAVGPPAGVRLLPPDDPYLYLDRDLVAPEPAWQSRLDSASVSRRLRNSLRGRVLVDGVAVGSWGRVQARVTVALWSRLPGTATDLIAAEAEGLAGPLGKPVRLDWL